MAESEKRQFGKDWCSEASAGRNSRTPGIVYRFGWWVESGVTKHKVISLASSTGVEVLALDRGLSIAYSFAVLMCA